MHLKIEMKTIIKQILSTESMSQSRDSDARNQSLSCTATRIHKTLFRISSSSILLIRRDKCENNRPVSCWIKKVVVMKV